MTVKIDFFSAGSCFSLESLMIKGGKWKSIRCPALCALITHPIHGYLLFDTGYSRYVLEQVKKFPMKLYSWVTPIDFQEHESLKEQLNAKGISPEKIKTIILSHFHIDHMGGLRDFPDAKFIFTRNAYLSTLGLKGWKALFSAYMSQLEPPHFDDRATILDQPTTPLSYPGFEKGYDLLGDQSIIAVDLPGHAAGQIGLFLRTDTCTILLAADACWNSRIYRECLLPHPIAKCIIHDYDAFVSTLRKLHRLHQLRPDIKIIPSHCQESICSLRC